MANKINIVITAEDKASKPIRGVADELDNGSGKANKLSGALGTMGAALAKSAVAMGVAGLAAGTFAVKAAADYEQSLNVFRSVSGATVKDMGAVAAASRALGNDMSLPGVSAADAASAMVELSKAGLSVNDTLAASKGVLSLAKAGQLDTAVAAEIAANALNAFSLNGKEATRVADLLAAAANASSADVQDLAYGLQMSSASAASVKVPVEDLTTLLAAMANNGIKGSDAGTSLKTMFMNLIPTTDRAKSSMADLNADFYDAKGNFVGVRDMIDQLAKGTKNLTDEQKAQHIENIFGADSSRAALVMIKEGVAGYDKLSAAVNKQGAATEMAAAQNAGFKGALDGLKSSLETVAIDVGMTLLPTLTSLTKYLSGNVEPTFNRMKEVIFGVGTQIGDYLGPKLQSLWETISVKILPIFLDLWHNVLEPLIPVIGQTLVWAIGAVTDGAKLLFDGIGFVYKAFQDGNPIILGLAGIFGTLAAAMAFNAIFNALSVGFATLTLITIPSAMASVGALAAIITAPIVMPAIIVGAAIAALMSVLNAYNDTKNAIDGQRAAMDQDLKSSKDLMSAARRARDAGKIDEKEFRRLVGIAANATGTTYSPGGQTLVGEHGPEIVNMPRGAQVIPAYRSREQTSGGGGHTVVIQNMNVNNGENPRRIFEEIGFALELAS